MSQCAVTVLMPAKNAEATIGRAVISLLPTLSNAEILVIDDGSTDDTVSILEQIADPRIRIVPAVGSGLVDALNQGLSEAKGRFVARADADDESLPGRLEHQLGVMERTGADLCVGVALFVDELGMPIIERERSTAFKKSSPCVTQEGFRVQLHVGCTVSHGAVMFRREAVLALGGYRREAYPGEDYDLWARMLLAGLDLVGDPRPVYRYTSNTRGISWQRAAEQRQRHHEVRTMLDESDPIVETRVREMVRIGRVEQRAGSRDHRRAYAESLLRLRSISRCSTPQTRLAATVAAHLIDPSLVARVYERKLRDVPSWIRRRLVR